MQLELLPGTDYYGKNSCGWVVLVDGQPHHFCGKGAKADAEEWMEDLDLKFNDKEAQNEKPD
jgi:hypothetical protein